MNWIFWLNIVSPHLSPLMRALASMPGQTVTVVAERALTEDLITGGWRSPDCSPARVVVRPSYADVERLIEEERRPQSVHILGGMKHGTLNRRVFPHLVRTGAMVGLLSEAADNRGICGLARKAQYSLDRHLFGRNVDFILAMGEQGARWFHSAGYDSSRIFPFGYVTERPVVTSENRMKAGERETFRILYLGQIVARKAGVTAIRALAQLSSLDWRFDVVGDGPDLPRWKTAALESGIAERVRFRPPVDNSILGSVLQEVDLLLLPSRFDGWGAVVNESLMSGIPVVCSDRCGAAGLLREACRGTIFKAGSVNSLREELQRWIERGKRTAETTARIREWSSVLEGPQLAQYLLQIIEYLRNGGHRPSPAWC